MNDLNEKTSENSFFEFLNKDQFLDLDQNNFLWEGDETQLLAVIKSLTFCNSSKELVGYITFWNTEIFLENKEISSFFEKLTKTEYNSLAVSAVFCYLKIKYQEQKKSLNYTAWIEILPIIVNPKVTDSLLDFLIKMEISYFLKITESGNEFMKAVSLYCRFIVVPYDYSWDLRGFSNLLTFLKIEKNTKKSLIIKTSEERSFNTLSNFVSNYHLTF